MANAGPYSGNDGAVYVGANAVANITDWQFTETIGTREQTKLGDTWRQMKPGLKTVQGRCVCWYDRNDASGQEALPVGAEVTLSLRNEVSGGSSDDPETEVTALITERSVTNGDGESTVQLEISFVGGTGSSLVSHTTVTP